MEMESVYVAYTVYSSLNTVSVQLTLSFDSKKAQNTSCSLSPFSRTDTCRIAIYEVLTCNIKCMIMFNQLILPGLKITRLGFSDVSKTYPWEGL